MENSELISLLEKEMIADVTKIDFPAENEDAIKLADVKEWYFEAEKVIRVLGNILSVPMNQAINQLRYAGHHILKVQTDNKVAKPNIIEAFKHCKRAVYDALDFYVYTLNERYTILMPSLDRQNAIKLERLLHEHIKKIQLARSSNSNRINYYKGVQDNLIDGLKLVEDINKIQRETGVLKELYMNKESMIYENHRLKYYIDTLQNKNAELEGALSGKFSRFSVIIAVLLGLVLPFGLIIGNAYITTSHIVTLTTQPTDTVEP